MIPVTLPSGREIVIPDGGVGTMVDYATQSSADFEDVGFHLEFQDLVDAVTEIGVTLRGAMVKIQPRKATVELAVGIEAKTGRVMAFFVEGGASGSMKVTLEWGDAAEPA